MTSELKIIRLKGQDIVPYIPKLAELRIIVFKEYPYLYLGNLEYETKYLQTYVNSPESIIVLVFDGERVVGASTAIPMQFETAEFKQAFVDHHMNIAEIFYLGESVLLPSYRKRGVYKHFFREREAAAHEYGCKITAFCAIERPVDDPRRPKDYVPLDDVWRYFGYVKHSELCIYFPWQEVSMEIETTKPLMFWLKTL
jgi:hypothetical protein